VPCCLRNICHFTRPLCMLDVRFPTRAARENNQWGNTQFFSCLNLNLSQKLCSMMFLRCELWASCLSDCASVVARYFVFLPVCTIWKDFCKSSSENIIFQPLAAKWLEPIQCLQKYIAI
jgi:hypothetical protein